VNLLLGRSLGSTSLLAAFDFIYILDRFILLLFFINFEYPRRNKLLINLDVLIRYLRELRAGLLVVNIIIHFRIAFQPICRWDILVARNFIWKICNLLQDILFLLLSAGQRKKQWTSWSWRQWEGFNAKDVVVVAVLVVIGIQTVRNIDIFKIQTRHICIWF